MAVHVPLTLRLSLKPVPWWCQPTTSCHLPMVSQSSRHHKTLYWVVLHQPFHINAKGENMVFKRERSVSRARYRWFVVNAKIKVRIEETTYDEEGNANTVTKWLTLLRVAVWFGISPQKVWAFWRSQQRDDQEKHRKTCKPLLPQNGRKDSVMFADQLMYRFCPSDAVRCLDWYGRYAHSTYQNKIVEAGWCRSSWDWKPVWTRFVTAGERYNKVIDIWSRTIDQIAKAMMDNLSQDTVVNSQGETEKKIV